MADCATCGGADKKKVKPGTYNMKDLSTDQVESLESMGVPEGYGQISPGELESMGLSPQFCDVTVTNSMTMWNGDPVCLPAEPPPCC